jgi:hypothetical protein
LGQCTPQNMAQDAGWGWPRTSHTCWSAWVQHIRAQRPRPWPRQSGTASLEQRDKGLFATAFSSIRVGTGRGRTHNEVSCTGWQIRYLYIGALTYDRVRKSLLQTRSSRALVEFYYAHWSGYKFKVIGGREIQVSVRSVRSILFMPIFIPASRRYSPSFSRHLVACVVPWVGLHHSCGSSDGCRRRPWVL